MTGSKLDAFACVLEKEGYNIWTALWLKENQRVNCQSFAVSFAYNNKPHFFRTVLLPHFLNH
jgi:hypothetical protein